MQEIIKFATELGFHLNNFDLDGKLHRFSRDNKTHKKDAWYVGWQHFGTKSGEPYYVLILGDWKTGEKHEYKTHGTKFTKEDQDIIRKRLSEAVQKQEEDRRQYQDEACKKAEKLVAQMRPVLISEYLSRKKITDLHGAGTIIGMDGERIIIVPTRDTDGKLWGAQRIFVDGNKLFLTGQKINGCFHAMGDPEDNFIYLAEGFATGATIRQATGKTVFVCFNAANLVNVAKEIRKKWVNKTIVVCGDDDHFTDGNPGRQKAEEAANACIGKAVFPKFKDPTQKHTDFNDLHVDEGIDCVKKQLEALSDPEPVGYLSLGFDSGSHFFFNMKSNDIVRLSTFGSSDFFELMPLAYWESAYMGKKGVRWDQAKSDIICTSKDIGAFDPFRIRGTGVWFDRGHTVINTGCQLISDGVPVRMGEFKTHYVYVATKNKMPPIHKTPLTVKETKVLLDVSEMLRWRDPKSWVFLSGWIAIARIAGALPIRPHIWVTGGSGTGKSTLMDKVVRPALGSEAGRLYLQGGSTEAGIRQSVRGDSLPIIFDEFETTGESSKERVQSLIELLRQAWSHTQGHVVKGSAGGTATHYALSFAALVSSIRVALDNDADRSRFCVIELAPHGNDKDHWSDVKEKLQIIDEEYGERLFSRMVNMIPIIRQSFEAASDALSGVVNQRFGQQYGMLIAGWYALMSDVPLSDAVAKNLVEELGFSGEKQEVLESTDEKDCFSFICTTRISTFDGNGGRVEKTIGEILKDGKQSELDGLKSYGILSEQYGDHFFIANDHAALRKYVFTQSRWSQNWHKTLLRLPGALRYPSTKWIGGKACRCVQIPKQLLQN